MRSGEVWLVELEPTRGAEIGKIRPVIIIKGYDGDR
jgi:mRNA-degrading endonuclease toxin of MazEF toxin-antitoxin module